MSLNATSVPLWTKDRLWALAAILVISIASFTGLTRYVDNIVFTFFSEAAPAKSNHRINIIAIDKRSLSSLGHLPWPRDTLARLLNIAGTGKPKVMALTLPLENTRITHGFSVVNGLVQSFKDDGLTSWGNKLAQMHQPPPKGTGGTIKPPTTGAESTITPLPAGTGTTTKSPTTGTESTITPLPAGTGTTIKSPTTGTGSTITPLGKALLLFKTQLRAAREALNQDKLLRLSLATTQNTDLGFGFATGTTQGQSDTPLSPVLLRNSLQPGISSQEGATPLSAYTLSLPLPQFLENALGVGALIKQSAKWGDYAGTPTVINYYGHLFPSLALLVAMQSLNLKSNEVHYISGKGLELGSMLIHTDASLRIHPEIYRPRYGNSPFRTYSFIDVLDGSINPNKFRDKILLIGVSSKADSNGLTGASNLDYLADEISSILNQKVIYTPPWGKYTTFALWGLLILYLLVVQPALSYRLGGILSHVFAIALLSASFYSIYAHQIWLSPTDPILLLLATYWIIYLKSRLFSEAGILKSSNSNLDNLKMLGLAYQNQGQLDLAFDRFRQLPTSGNSLDLLYNLGLDYERKRRFDKAYGVYEYITLHKKGYRDIQERMKRTQTLSEITLNQNNPGGTHQSTIILNTNGLQKPMLGRYQVEREIGHGAMSIVYEGKDPKIGRRVAIKTLPLSSEFQGVELEHVKARFYREAETAGQLSHPNIVTIYDAGEEDDIAYIAMEYLEGKNLTRFVGRSELLPVSTVLEIVGKCALALDYAHRHQVIHRDVKPANIVYNANTGEVKLTDFGIARITDASKTRTGVIMGTPTYMSPEQLAGRNLDGRSDLFSLGITCFHLLTGAPPFQADTMATLMYKITNEAHPALNSLRDDLAPCVSPILNKLLQKNPEKRYQTGRDLANQLLRCARHIREQNT